MLLAKGRNGLTAWDIAAEKGKKEISETLWGRGREVQVKLEDDLLLANRFDRLTDWDITAFKATKRF
jgi:hypothetical protein